MTHRWIKFWPQDWQRDPALRSCSISARGLWIEMLCVMHDGEPYGHLTINSKAATSRQIASIASVTEKDAVKMLAELEESGVFSRTEDGLIFSRRMVRDKAISDKASTDGKTGGNPNLKATKAKQVKGDDNGGGNGDGITEGVNPPAYAEPYPGVQTLEAEARKKEAVLRTDADASPPDARAELWTVGLAMLRAMTGQGDGQSRNLLGKLSKALKDDCAGVLAILHDATDLRPGDPIPWLMAAAKSRAEPKLGSMDKIRADWDLPGLQWKTPPTDDTAIPQATHTMPRQIL